MNYVPDPKLQAMFDEMIEVGERHDMAFVIVGASPKCSGFTFHLSTSWAAIEQSSHNAEDQFILIRARPGQDRAAQLEQLDNARKVLRTSCQALGFIALQLQAALDNFRSPEVSTHSE